MALCPKTYGSMVLFDGCLHQKTQNGQHVIFQAYNNFLPWGKTKIWHQQFKKEKSHQYQIHKKHITSITTPLRANFIIHASSLGDRAIYTDHTCECVHVCLYVCMGVYEAHMHVDGANVCDSVNVFESRAVLRLCVWGLSGSVCACVCEAEMSLCSCFHLATLTITIPQLPINLSTHERKGEAAVLLKCEEKLELFLHISATQYQGPFHIFIRANHDPLH